MEPAAMFDGIPELSEEDAIKCLPLLGVLLRTGGTH